jgi:hypothetical protein
MPQNTHLTIAADEAARLAEPASEKTPENHTLQTAATRLAQSLVWLPNTRSSTFFSEENRKAATALRPVLKGFRNPARNPSDDVRWLTDNWRLIATEIGGLAEALKPARRITHVRTNSGAIMPRAAAIAEDFARAVDYHFTETAFTAYLQSFQAHSVLDLKELWALVPAMKLVFLREIAVRGAKILAGDPDPRHLGPCVASLRALGESSWKRVLEPLVAFDPLLRQDPAGAYAAMDFESRTFYRDELARLAGRSDFTEMEVAAEVLKLAREAQHQMRSDPRISLRRSHVGFYLVAEGRDILAERIGYRPPFPDRFTSFLRRHPDELYLTGIGVLTFAFVTTILLLLTRASDALGLLFIAALALLIPCSQSAVLLMNYLATALLRARILPKLDFASGIPGHCPSLVAIPCLLLNERQVRRLVDDLEVRFLGNRDPQLHFVILSDLPDAAEPSLEDNPMVELCSQLIVGLNQKYSPDEPGPFLHLHRHRIWNPREKVWMGWERKRGKLMDLNKLLRHRYDSFPVKVGDTAALEGVRFVITLDADTELPRGAAQRMIGALAHPLNQAIIDPDRNIVVAGYGILQPRVGVSVQSAAASRLASIYSGETGLDIYTRAISDVYQDLYGEGSFTGKGIYEVETLYRVLDNRFPRNALLSHDLIEGAYARAGLVSDIEVIEDYPSHYSAYNRRKHRWLRGDWQVAGWLFPRVPDESGRLVRNPISLVSQWKILDNLRRSLVEPATFLLLVLGWLLLPGDPRWWTLAIVTILFIPAWFELAFGLVRSLVVRKPVVARESLSTFLAANLSVFFSLTFLAHQTLISLDAVARAVVRHTFTRQRLLEWETAAEAELGSKRTPVDNYLDWVPVLATALLLCVYFLRPAALFPSAPILVLWAVSKLVALWLNRSPRASRNEIPLSGELLVRRAALRTWRYFANFSTAEHNWLILDNVQVEPPCTAARVSPTNIGLLLNARQVACDFGYLTLPEFALQTQRTFRTLAKMERYRGHWLNWYDTQSLQVLPPAFVSSVDSGNLLASLWTLRQGSLERRTRPLVDVSLLSGLQDILRLLDSRKLLPRKWTADFLTVDPGQPWLPILLACCAKWFDGGPSLSQDLKADAASLRAEADFRFRQLRRLLNDYCPWLLPEFADLRREPSVGANVNWEAVSLERAGDFIDRLTIRLQALILAAESEPLKELARKLESVLPKARGNVLRLEEDLLAIAERAGKFADEMDFSFLLDPRRLLLSVGFDCPSQTLNAACYDLLATESRIAVFTAVAKDDIPQESWFLLGRAHTTAQGHPVLLSWTGTMFEYLMPALWMRAHPNTLLGRTQSAVVEAQRAYTTSRGIPWGISESAYFATDAAGNYQYYAFGLPSLALRQHERGALVISPYSTFLALQVEPLAALKNLHKMERLGWLGEYGFYEAVDYSSPRRSWRHRYDLVRCWMAHHHGMSLLAMANFLHNGVVTRWFHSDPRVQATELLLHEKPVHYVRVQKLGGRAA